PTAARPPAGERGPGLPLDPAAPADDTARRASDEGAVPEGVAHERRQPLVARLVMRRDEGDDEVGRGAAETGTHRRGRLVHGRLEARSGRRRRAPSHALVPSTDASLARGRLVPSPGSAL